MQLLARVVRIRNMMQANRRPLSHYPFLSLQQIQTQTEILTQNPDLTQLGDSQEDEEECLSQLPPLSPSTQRATPWGRLIPTAGNPVGHATDLLPRAAAAPPLGGVSFLGLDHLHPNEPFNVYTLGRSAKCDIQALDPTTLSTAFGAGATLKHERARRKWAFGMISNQHCKIYCCLQNPGNAAGGGSGNRQAGIGMEVYVEDCSGNGTLINQQTLLRRGQKRILHSGDEICLVNPQTLQKKVRSNAGLQTLTQQHSFVFVTVQPPAPLYATSSLHAQVVARSSKRKAPAVDVRAMRMPKPTRAHSAAAPTRDSPTNNNNQRRISPRRQQPRRVEEDYDIREVLGTGTVGEVRRAIHRQTGQERAIKIISIGGRNRAAHFFVQANVEAEATILQGLKHPYVVQLVDVYVSSTVVYLVMELLHGGDLFDRIIEKGKYSETESRRVMRRLLSAIHYLHCDKNIVHRDLKPENILLNSHSSVVDIKLTDFGLAKSLNGVQGLKTFCGTPQYFAPEVLKRRTTVTGRGRYGQQADMWSLGVILYVLLSGTPPFDVDPDAGVTSSSPAADDYQRLDFPAEHWSGVSQAAKDLVRNLLVMDPRRRSTVEQACKHEWILTEDGDTHRHPLRDPKLQKVLDDDNKDIILQQKPAENNFDSYLLDGETQGQIKVDCKDVQDEEPVADRRPLSPVQLNNETNCSAPAGIMDSSIGGGEKTMGLPRHPFPGISQKVPASSCSPRTSAVPHRSAIGRVSDEMGDRAGFELSEDEVNSTFSEQTESISSFTTTAEEVGAASDGRTADCGGLRTTSGNNRAKGAVRHRKRRVTDTMASNRLSRSGFTKKPRLTASRNRSPPPRLTKSSVKNNGTSERGDMKNRGKQAKISQWFCKNS